MEAKIGPKSQKKRFENCVFFYRPLDSKMEGKRVPKPTEMEANTVENRSQKRAQRKNEESMKTNNSPTFWLDFECLRGRKIEEEIEKRVSETIQNQRVILKRIFKGFLSILVPFWNPGWTQNRKKRDQKQDRFWDQRPGAHDHQRADPARKSRSSLERDRPWGASQFAPGRVN